MTLLPPQIEQYYLQHTPPLYDDERYQLGKRMISTVVLCIFLIPYATLGLMKKYKLKKKELLERKKKETTMKQGEMKGKKKKKGRGKKVTTTKANKAPTDEQQQSPVEMEEEEDVPEEEQVYLPWYAMPFLNSVCFLSLFILALTSSNNTYTPRAIFQTPIFTQEECAVLVNAVAEKKEGWEKKINLQNNEELEWKDKLWLEEKLNYRLVPMVERVYGVVPKSMHCTDLSIVRYNDKTTNTEKTKPHVDSSDISFTILLRDTTSNPKNNNNNTTTAKTTSGKMRFYNRPKNISVDITPLVGNGLIYSGSMLHHSTFLYDSSSSKESSAEIIQLVGLLTLERSTQELTGNYTGLSLFASWLDLNWLSLRLSSSSFSSSSTITTILEKMGKLLQYYLDMSAPHFHVKLVENSTNFGDETFRGKFLEIMEEGVRKRKREERRRDEKKEEVEEDLVSIWFGAEHIKRQEEEKKFLETNKGGEEDEFSDVHVEL